MEKLNYMAFRDGLTGLYNRRYVIGDLVEDITKCTGEERKNVLILADIDNFKMVNDTYGHEAGDMALVCIANIMEGICRDYKGVRWGCLLYTSAPRNAGPSGGSAVNCRIRHNIQTL